MSTAKLKEEVFQMIEECHARLQDSAPDIGGVEHSVRAYCEALAAMPKEEAKKHRPDLEKMMEAVNRLSEALKSSRDDVQDELRALDRIRQANAAYLRSRSIGDKKQGGRMTPDLLVYARAGLALVFVIGLIFISAGLARRTGLERRLSGNKGNTRRLSITETLYLDPKHRLVIVRCDDEEHVLLLGASGPLLIESRKKEERKEKPRAA